MKPLGFHPPGEWGFGVRRWGLGREGAVRVAGGWGGGRSGAGVRMAGRPGGS